MAQCAAAVLCGGASRRMGRDKASIGDPPWAHRVAQALLDAGCTPVELQGGDPALGTTDLVWFADVTPLGGPTPAIAQAAARHRGSELVVAACDLPGLGSAGVTELLEAARGSGGRIRGAHAFHVGGRPNWSLLVMGADEVGRVASLRPSALHGRSIGSLLGDDAVLHHPDLPDAVTDIDRPEQLGSNGS